MTLNAHILNGNIVLDEPHSLPEGAAVQVVVIVEEMTADISDKVEPPTLYERLAPVIGTVSGLPSDLAINHDHYLYGVSKNP
ncbi:MAG: hypothetical protein ACKVP0_02625 [Pirellulaceae bacterium]